MKFIFLSLFLLASISCEKENTFAYLNDPPTQDYDNNEYALSELVKDKKIDVLWVIDNSGSMQSIQNNIVKNSKIFMDNFTNLEYLEWKMGLISTDKSEQPYLGFDAAVPFDYNIDPQIAVGQFQNAVNSLGVNGDAYEYIFHNIDRMITPIGTDYTHFFRPDAHLVVIMVTDEEEQSAQRINSTKYEALTFYNAVRGIKDNTRVVRFYGAFDFQDMQDCTNYVKYKGSPLEKIIVESGGIAMSACVDDFGTRLAEISKDITSILGLPSLLLKKRPVIESIKVIYKDQELPGGASEDQGVWYYDRYYNTINFYNLEFAKGSLKDAMIKVEFDVDDGVNRDEQ